MNHLTCVYEAGRLEARRICGVLVAWRRLTRNGQLSLPLDRLKIEKAGKSKILAICG